MDELKDNAGIFAASDHVLPLQPALDDVANDVAAANQRVADITKGVEVPEEQTGQAKAIWNRAKDRIDKANGIPKKVAAMQDLIGDAEGLALQVYQTEFPFYANTEGLPGDWLPAAFAARIPGAADEVAAANLLQKHQSVLIHNHQKIFRALNADTEVPPLLDPYAVSAEPYSNPTGA